MTVCACSSNSLANNDLVGETYLNAAEVQGDSKEVGAKVIYQGREMVVSKDIDRYGELKMYDFSGITAMAEALKVNKGLSSIKCASLLFSLSSFLLDMS